MDFSKKGMGLYPDREGNLVEHAIGLVDMTNDAYHAGPGISKSHLDVIAGASPRHYWWRYLSGQCEPTQPTPAMQFGTAVHTAILEPDLVDSQIIESPDFDRRSKNGKAMWDEFVAQNAGKLIFSPEDYKRIMSVRDAVHAHSTAGGLLKGGQSEQSFFAIDRATGELIKCRTDFMHDSGKYIVDVKTTTDASPEGFAKSSANFRYPLQPAWYYKVLDTLYGEHPDEWVFLAVETQPPYAIGLYYVDDLLLERAQIAAERDFQRIVQCRRAGASEAAWPDYGSTPTPLLLPSWAKL